MSRIRRISVKGTEMGLALLLLGDHGSESRQSLKFHTQNENKIIQLPSINIEVIEDKINGHKKADDLQLEKFDAEQNGDDHHGTKTEHVHSHGPSHMLFFTMEELMVGKILPVYFRRTNPSTSPHFLPREEADSIPFSLKELPNLLQFFSFSQDSPQAKAIEDTLRQCEIEPIKGETKSCVTSLESMLDFARSVFGLNSDFNLVATTYHGNSNIRFQNYTILEVPKENLASEMVACHSMLYTYAVFYCHSQKSENKVYRISLGGDDGERVEAVAVCPWIPRSGAQIMHRFACLGLYRGLPLCATSSQLINSYGFQHLLLSERKMGLGLASSSLLLHLLPVMCAYGSACRRMNMQSMESQTRDEDKKIQLPGSSQHDMDDLQSMLDFTRGLCGLDSSFSAVTTEYLSHSNVSFQNYTILELRKEISASKMVACHSLRYPHAVFYCHSQKSENKVYKVSLGGENN
ncbi:hypothetical protein FEM48_Zijuj09G0106000 [Ziziphus jujuba var. spinosa]|uniref:BURP domain-containing protein n=1 Tax=Ziziphus jujuba var. spinosa TaxID=714518 RepID=A0A978USI1_ZIZJJ|nr:hypothetical protein FEM48_Zijuj09G0106000 [Ziziphus jujuba var. spinosa]